MATAPLLEIEALRVCVRAEGGPREVIANVSLRINAGEAVAIVGESGSGKTTAARAIARGLPDSADVGGSIRFNGAEVLQLQGKALRDYRTNGIGMIFQDPRAHINPVRTIGDFLTEALRTNLGVKPSVAMKRAAELLGDVGVADAPRRLRQYPHQLSGGLLQRVMIAAAIAPGPQLLIADEPTTALDVTTQAEVVAILNQQRRDRGMAMMFITHNLDLAAAVCDRTAVMYAGRIVEEQASATLHERPLHPYTAALVKARPDIASGDAPMDAIGGRPISAFEAPPGCPFSPRCRHAETQCQSESPVLRHTRQGRVACVRVDELFAATPDRHTVGP